MIRKMNLIEIKKLTTHEHVQAHIHELKKLLVIQYLRPVHTSNYFFWLFVLLLYHTIIRTNKSIPINTWHIKSNIIRNIAHIHSHISDIFTNYLFVGR